MSTIVCEGALTETTVKCPQCGGRAVYRTGRTKAFLRCEEDGGEGKKCRYECSWDL